jgi:uncharacterized YccA/Bax inhibitor family protein
MRSNNPVFSRSETFARGGYGTSAAAATRGLSPRELNDMYNAPTRTPVHERKMTLDSVIMRTAACFAVLLAFAGLNFVLANPLLTFGGMIVGLVLGLVISFKQSTNPGLILTYAAVEGLFVGGISRFYEAYAGGLTGGSNIVMQAVIGTLAAFGSMLFVYKMGWLRATPKFTRGLMIAGGAYLLIALASVVSSFFGVGGGWGFQGVGALGILLCLAGVGLATLFLILDFDFIERGIAAGAPERMAWLGAFGLMVTLVWLYLEILRLLAILRGDD